MTEAHFYVAELRTIVERESARLLGAAPDAVERRPAKGGWSAKEVLGHLIDSAAVNHQRFVRAQWQDLVFASYAQEDWVAAQKYQDAPWIELVALWREYNRHLARVMAAIPIDVRLRPQRRHNLNEITMNPAPAEEPSTLDYLMRDYVEHLQHHVRQIDARIAGRD
ncbi:MAG TPA: DinB family protein [Gemmatimonadaceae bacterium]|nr:DinB family protein [Gemmatimonadaceae bacterium]